MKTEDKLSTWAEEIFKSIKDAKKVSDTNIIAGKIDNYQKNFGKTPLVQEMRDLVCDKSFELFLLEYPKPISIKKKSKK